MEVMNPTQAQAPAERAEPAAANEMLSLPQRCRRLGWLAGILACALVAVVAWSMVQFSVRCAVREAGH